MSNKRIKMHMHTKKYINNLYENFIHNNCKVSLIKLTAEDITNYKLSLIKNKDHAHNEDGNKSIDDEPAKKKQKLNTNGINVLKLVLSRVDKTQKFKSQFKSSVENNKEIVSTSNSSTKNVKPMNLIIDSKKMIDEDKYKNNLTTFFHDDKSKRLTNGIEKLAVVKPSTSRPNPSLHSTIVNGVEDFGNSYVGGNLIEIEKLHKKYFSKSTQDSIVIIANILKIIIMSNKHLQARVTKSFKKSSEAAKLKERYEAHQLHKRCQKILETKLIKMFISVILSFAEPEFDSAFQMFFLSILSVIRTFDLPQFRKSGIKKLVHLLWNSLKNSKYNHSKIVSMFESKKFQSDCIDLTRLIENSRNNDPGVTDQMSKFFESRVNSQQYFQTVIDAITNDRIKDLAFLIKDAIFQCLINSELKDPVDSSTLKHLNFKIPVTETIQNCTNSSETTQDWFLTKNLDETYQQITVLNGNKSQINGNTTVEPSIVASRLLSNFYESFCSSLQKENAKFSTSQVIPTKKLGVSPTISNSPLLRITNSWSITATSDIDTNILVEPPPTVLNKCYAENCNKSATIMCSICTTAKYCSHECHKCDWYGNHINDCKKLLNIKQT